MLLLALVCACRVDSALAADRLNDTGVATCYDSAGSPVPCNTDPAGDDGRFGRDAAATMGVLRKTGAGPAGFDFTKIAHDGRELPATAILGNSPANWACTRDNATGLVWEVKTMGGDTDLRSRRQHFTWYNTNASENGGNAGSRRVTDYSSCNNLLAECNTQEYIARMNNLALCGFRDWRLPTPVELRGIVNYARGEAGEFNTDYFTSHDPQWPSPHYWTSSTYAADPADTWLVEIGGEADGGGAGHHHTKSEQRLVLLVRGDPPRLSAPCGAGNPRANVIPSTPTSDFINHGDGTVTHVKTGLTWKRCAEGLSGESCLAGRDDSFFWRDALNVAEASTFAGFSDWRLPNVKELHSLVETCGYELAINQSVFPNTPFQAGGAVFWTSTPDPRRFDNAYLVSFQHGGAVPVGKNSKIYVRLVRGGDAVSAFDAQNPQIPGLRRRAVRR